MDIILIRHTSVDAAPGTCYGRRDLGLAANPEAQFERLDTGLPSLDAVATSPLRRCLQLAQWLSQRRDLPLHTDSRWQELDFGQWEGRRWDDIGRTQRAALDRWALDPMGFAAPGGESVQALHARVQAALAALHGQARQMGWRRVGVVTHGGPIRALLARAMGLPGSKLNALDVPFGGVFALRHRHSAGGEGLWQRVTLEDVRLAVDAENPCAP